MTNAYLLLILINILPFNSDVQYYFPDSIESKKTINHINIPGTRLFIIPPVGYSVLTTLPAIKKGDQEIIQIIDLVGGNYINEIENLKEKIYNIDNTIKLYSKIITLNGIPADIELLKSKDVADRYTWLLSFGDYSFCTMVYSTFSATEKFTEKQILYAFQEIYYDKDYEVSPVKYRGFNLNEEITDLKFAKYTGSLYIYTVNGLDKAYYYPSFLVGKFPSNLHSVESAVLVMYKAILYNGLSKIEIRNEKHGRTNGYDSYQCEIYGILDNKKYLIYFHSVLIENEIIVMEGYTNKDLEKSLAKFIKFSNTIKKQ